MPLRAFWYSLLFAVAVTPVLAQTESSDWTGWMSTAEMMELPTELRKSIPEWCPGTYYHPELAAQPEHGDSVLSAERSRMDEQGMAELTGDVLIELPGTVLHADRARLNQQSGNFELEGNILARGRNFSILGDTMGGNLDTREGQFSRVLYTLHDQHARGRAERIDRAPPLTHIRGGTYTTCAPGQHGWLLAARDIELDSELGWGKARHLMLRLRGVPVLYLPWITFPIDERRKSGLLFPTLSTADEGGLDITQPLYLNLHPQLDATISARHIHNRGSGMENELRYLTRAGEGAIRHAWLHSDRQFNDEDRELLAWKHGGRLSNWHLSADVNYISDDFYFEDLDTGLDVRARTHLSRMGQARYRGDTWDFRARLQAWQTIDPTIPDARLPFRRMPQLSLTGEPNLLGPVRLLWDSEFTRFERTDVDPAAELEGGRFHLQPALTLPLRRSWGYVEPRVRIYHTRYGLEGAAPRVQDEPDRTLSAASLDAGIFLERPLFGNESGLVQTLEPRLFYNFIEFADQSDLPEFDSGKLTLSWTNLFREQRFTGPDRIGDEDRLTLGLTSRIIQPGEGSKMLRLRSVMAWHRRDREVQLRNAAPETTPRTPLVTDATWFQGDNWQLFAQNHWDTEHNQSRRTIFRAGYSKSPRRAAHIGYHRRPLDEVSQGELAAAWPVHANWSLLGRWLYDFERERSVESLAGLEYRDCCWQVRFVGLRELSRVPGETGLEADNRYFLQLRLIGLGGLGDRLDELLDRSIPGLRD